MVQNKMFLEVGNQELLRELRSLLKNERALNLTNIYKKNWVVASLDDKQIFGQDAINLAYGACNLGILKIYAAWVSLILDKDDFLVYEINPTQKDIERLQWLDESNEFDAKDGVLFTASELKFFILRPCSADNMYYAGTQKFIFEATSTSGWVQQQIL